MENNKTVQWVLRVAVAGEFIGHGVFAIQGKADWIKWFGQFGVSDPSMAGTLLFWVGILDICVRLLECRSGISSSAGQIGERPWLCF